MAGNSVAIDTNVAVKLLNGDPTATNAVQRFGLIYLPVIVVGELRYGAHNSSRVHENLILIEKLAGRCTILDVSLSTSEKYAALRWRLKQLGKPIPENDLWIAAICAEHDLPRATDDAHFAYVDALTLVPLS